jgi:hypothetical protein
MAEVNLGEASDFVDALEKKDKPRRKSAP